MTPDKSGRRTDERGVVAVVVALAMTALLITGAIVLDFGFVRYERQTNKSAADSAVTASLRSGDGGTGDVYTDRAVCGALSFLKANRSSMASLPAGICASPDAAKVCDPTNATTLAATSSSYTGTTTFGSNTYTVWIKAPYVVTDTSTGGGFPEESTATTLSGDPGVSGKNGCDQVGVIIQESTQPGLGRIVRSSDIVSRIRSVGRVGADAGDQAPALLMLERTKCSVVTVNSAANSYLRVYGSGTTPGSIHADSAGTAGDCGSGSNQQMFQGQVAGGIAAYGAGGVSGSITSYGTLNGLSSGVASDSSARVFGSTAPNENVVGVTTPVAGRNQVTRKPIDVRYRAGITSAITAATSVWSLNPASPGGIWSRVGCNPTAAQLGAPNSTQGLYVDCSQNSGITLGGTINAGSVFFNGWIAGGTLSMPSASTVYINNPGAKSTAISLSNGDTFCIRASVCNAATPTVSPCSNAATLSATSKAQFLVRDGSLKQTNGLLKMCNTTMIALGGQTATGCVPTSNGTAPATTPCGGGAGTSQMSINGGYQDWTAPNQYSGAIPKTSQSAAWDGGEDLALWDESFGGTSNSNAFTMAGGGNTHTVGVFMAPNAAPFGVTGGGVQTLQNAQYIATSFQLNGGATLNMTVDPNNAVTLPALGPFNLVR